MAWSGVICAGNPAVKARCMSTQSPTDVSVVYVTVPAPGAEDVAKALASKVIESKLAACVNIIPGCHFLSCFICPCLGKKCTIE